MIHSYDDWDKRVRAEYRSAEDNIVSMYADWTADRESVVVMSARAALDPKEEEEKHE